LPSATVISAEIGPLLSEGAVYADRLKIESVNVEYRDYKGVTQEFFGVGVVVKKAKDAEDFDAANLKKTFAK